MNHATKKGAALGLALGTFLMCQSQNVEKNNNNGSAKRAAKKEQSMKIDIGVSEQNRKAVGEILNNLLADEFALYTKTLNFHWNVVGPLFHDLHAMFKEQYEQLFDIIDSVAERARSIDVVAHGTLQQFKQNTRLQENPGSTPKASDMIAEALQGHESIIKQLRTDIPVVLDKYQDAGTNNFLIDLLEKHEKTAWMLRAALK